MITLQINGETKQLENSSTIAEMILELALPAPTILVEHNGLALRRSEWPRTHIANGDRVEILHVAAGG